MKTGKSLQEMAIELDRREKSKVDYLVDTRAFSMTLTENTPVLSMDSKDCGWRASLQINDIAHRQIGQCLGIPAKYYDKMRAENTALLATNVNTWFKSAPDTRMVRTLDGTARAFLSERYRRIDNAQVASAVLPIISSIPDARVESCELTDSRMYLKVVNPRLTAEISKGDVVQSGIVISNSEVGMGSVAVAPLIYRLVCSNGMIAADSKVRKYHVGRVNEADNDYSIYRSETIEADDHAFLLKVQDTVRAVVEHEIFNGIVSRMREAKEAKIDAKVVPQVVELTSKDYSITDAESESILGYLIGGGDLSLYGLANAVTRHAQDVESYDRSTELETIGYRVMTMPGAQWRRINAI